MLQLPFAHETWFVHEHVPWDWGFALAPLSLALFAVALLATLVVRLLARVVPGVDVPALARLAPWMPFAVRLHVAVSLLGLLGMGLFLSPAMPLHKDVVGVLLGAGMALVTVAFAAGYRTRAAAWLLIALGPLGIVAYGVEPVVSRIDLLGLAAFVLLAGPGRWSADAERGLAHDPSVGQAARAVFALRVAAGLALIVVAFAEKLAKPELGLETLRHYPVLNVGHAFGMGDVTFLRAAGAIEVLFGLLLISGALLQLCVLIAGVPFNATLWFFGSVELIGHLPIYGAMLVLLVYGSDPTLRPGVSDLRPWRRRGAPTRPPRRRARTPAGVA